MSQHTPTPWIKSTYTATDAFRSITEHESLCKEDGTLLALFGPKGHPQSIIDRDMVEIAVNSHEALLRFAKKHHEVCEECEGTGRVYNNADPTSGQWVTCPYADAITQAKAHHE